MNDQILTPLSTRETALEARGLSKIYRNIDIPALDGIDLKIMAGSIFGLLGPNGAGKTTAISIMSTLLKATRGTVNIFGVDCNDAPSGVREMIGLVPQDIALYSSLSGRENLNYFGSLYGIPGDRLNKRVDECLVLVGLDEHGDNRVGSYSGGMKRRVNLAVGIIHGPKFLFLDEPTVGIDAQSRNMIMDRLLELRDQGMTMLYTTHYMEEAEKICDEVAVIDHGKIISKGVPSEMMRDGGFTSLQDLFFSLTGRSLRD
jgi:ABC-2 type transport system ATP-binding protein